MSEQWIFSENLVSVQFYDRNALERKLGMSLVREPNMLPEPAAIITAVLIISSKEIIIRLERLAH